jgi:hypothetical protein
LETEKAMTYKAYIQQMDLQLNLVGIDKWTGDFGLCMLLILSMGSPTDKD